MKPVLHIYTRVSSSAQEERGSSLDSQKELGINKSEELGFDHKIWNEGGKSSKYEDLENRPILKQLLVEMEKGVIEHLFVYNTDRISRNQKTWGAIRWKLKEHSVKLYTPSGAIDLSSAMDDLVIGILAEISQYDNSLRTERSRLGKLNKVRQGYWKGGPPTFGFKIEDKRLVENKDESKWIRKIYEWYSRMKTIKWIKFQLESNQVLTRRQNTVWSLGSIEAILKNPQYIGRYTFTDSSSQESVDCFCPALIDEDLWSSVQEKRKRNSERRTQNNPTKRFYLLRNLMFCGHCGRQISGRIKESKDERLYYCPEKERIWKTDNTKPEDKYVHGRGCSMNRSLNIPRTDTIVWNTVIDVLSDSDVIKQEIRVRLGGDENYETEARKAKALRNRLRKELTENQNGMAQLEMNKALQVVDPETYSMSRKGFEERKQLLTERLEQSINKISEMSNHKSWLASVSRFYDQLDKMNTESDSNRKKFLELFVEKIDVHYDDKTKEHELIIKFKLPIVDDDDYGEGEAIPGKFMKKALVPPSKSIQPRWSRGKTSPGFLSVSSRVKCGVTI
jgi:DNA invertase Pin-like site-specific DNA recombinase